MIQIERSTVHAGGDEPTFADLLVSISDKAPLDSETNKPVWPDDSEIARTIARHLGWDAAREIECVESDDGLHREYQVIRRYVWDVRFTVDALWVADGFSLDDERAHDMLAHHLDHAYDYEMDAKVLRAPDADSVAREQGYAGKDDPRFKEP